MFVSVPTGSVRSVCWVLPPAQWGLPGQAHLFVGALPHSGRVNAVVFAQRNGFDLAADVDDAERIILRVAAGDIHLDQPTHWIAAHLRPIPE